MLWNPLRQCSAEYIAQIKDCCIEVARKHRIRLVWDVEGLADYDYREQPRVGPTLGKAAYDRWDRHMKLLTPGYCRYARDRLRVTVDGCVAPCTYSTDGELELGNLADLDFDALCTKVILSEDS